MQIETETKEKPAEKMVDAEHAPGKQMDMTVHQEGSLESEAAFTTNTNSTSIQTRSPLKSHPLFNNYDLWKRKLRENCFKRVRDDRKRLLWKMRMLPPSQPLNLDSKDLVKYDFHGIVSDELKNLKESSLSYSSKISNSTPCSDDLLWDYNGLHDAYQGECEEMMLEMQRIFYEDLRAESIRQEPESYIETWQDDEDEYLARAVYEHMQLNEKQLHEVIWCPICREGHLREDHHFICCTLCELKLNKGDEVNLELLRDRLVEVCAEHLDSGCVLKPNFCLETRFDIAALYILCNGCNTFELDSPTIVKLNLQSNDFGNFLCKSTIQFTNSKPRRSCSIRCKSTSTDETKTRRNLLDNASNLLTNLLSGGRLESMPIAEGAVSDLFGRPLFFSLYDWFIEHGSVYKLAFGPKAFVVVSDPIVARHILRENAFSYDKGVLADILEPIMGKGLIPADLDTWKQRRRVIAPGFHTSYLEATVKIFTSCSKRTMEKFDKLLETEDLREGKTITLDLEAEFSSLALDIIGLGVFNYDFGSVTKESPVIKAVYGTLFEAEHRSTFYLPYWKIPLMRWIVPRQRKFQNDLNIINDCLDRLISNAKETREETDVEKLQQRDYSNLKDASLLRFLVDMRGVDIDDRQLRDDLMTMLIAGHETTAAVLTWAVFLLAQSPSKMKKAQAEIDFVIGQEEPTFESLKKLEYIRLIVVEALRLYPQPPLLVRRALRSDILPGGHKGDKDSYAISAGTDIFISVYNLHRSPYFWDRPNAFEPERFLVQKKSEDIEGWAGFDPSRIPGALYPNELISDFAFLPFGGGPRKCVGDQFALMESTVALAMLLQKFDIELNGSPESVELVTGATIHTKNGLWCKLRKRSNLH